MMDYLIKDIEGKPINEGELFSFKYLSELKDPIELKGSFSWNGDELRYEINIHDNEDYVCLSYVTNGVMYGFKKL